jgi:hypothetical protein
MENSYAGGLGFKTTPRDWNFYYSVILLKKIYEILKIQNARSMLDE